jgi:alkylation response protein AidB-like acyl-CoA dehydrogenase
MATYGTVDVWLDRIKDIAPIIREHAAEADAKRRLSRPVVDAMLQAAAGTSAIRNEYKFQQYFRDVHTITQHAFASASRYESVGARMLGVESDWGFFAF